MPEFLAAALSLLLLVPALAQKAPPVRPAITGIAHLTLYADDIPASEKFYTSMLGWKEVPKTGTASAPGTAATPAVRFYANHAQYVQLVPAPQPGQADRLDSVAFATADVETLRQYLAARGVAVPGSVTDEGDGSRSFVVHDPEGNKVEFTQQGRGTPPPPSPAPLSTHIMHAGYLVRDRAALDHFYKDVLGFHLYWQGGAKPGDVDWVMMQAPEGTDWIEYMLNLPAQPSRAQLGSANHLAPGVVSVAELQKRLEARGWKAPAGANPQILGVDGKLQLDLHDPDGTRIEFMEFKPVQAPCCSPYTGRQPVPSDAW